MDEQLVTMKEEQNGSAVAVLDSAADRGPDIAAQNLQTA
jgi:hypothetical protein